MRGGNGFTLTELLLLALGIAVASSFLLPGIYQSRRLENEANAKEVLAMMKSASHYWQINTDSPISLQRFRLAPLEGAYPLLPFLKSNSQGETRYGGFDFQVITKNHSLVATATPTLLGYSGSAVLHLDLATEGYLATQFNPE